MKPRLEFEHPAGQAYVRLRRGKIARTIELGSHVLVDVDKRGRAVGVEFPWTPPAATVTSVSGTSITTTVEFATDEAVERIAAIEARRWRDLWLARK